MNTAPGGDAMTVRYHHDTDAARLKHANVRRPIAWRIHLADAARFAAEGQHCQTRRCREPIAIVTWRWWRSSEIGRVLVAEHFVCGEHGARFAERHHIRIDPEPEREARHLSSPEMTALTTEGRHCAGPACENPATFIFLERYTTAGEPRVAENLACDEHAAMYAYRFQVKVAAAPGDPASREDSERGVTLDV
jgi:hypothetical protein